MKALGPFETSVYIYHLTLRNIPEDRNLKNMADGSALNRYTTSVQTVHINVRHVIKLYFTSQENKLCICKVVVVVVDISKFG